MELRRLGAICLVSASVIAMTSGRADATSFTYTFDSDSQGWNGIGSGGISVLDWGASGGNPGGYVSNTVSGGIDGTGAVNPTRGLSRSLSLDLATYGATLSFDTALLAGSNLIGAHGVDVVFGGVLNGNPFVLEYAPQFDLTGGAWTSTSVRLDASAPWTFRDIFAGSSHAATQADWNTLLPLVSSLLITDGLSFLRSTGGGGTFGFDNLKLTEAAAPTAVPEPTSMLLLATGLAGVALRRKSRLLRPSAR